MISSVFYVLTVFLGAAILAALFAGSETGLYQISPLRIRLGLQAGHLPYKAMARLMHDRAALLFSMLIGTNIMQYLATSIVTHAFLNYEQTAHTAELLTTVITAPILFIFSELIPKNVFYYRADVLMPLVANMLYLFHKCFTYCGLVPLLRKLSHLIAQFAGLESSAKSTTSASQRHRMEAIIRDTHDEGLLTHVQTDIIGRIIGNPPIRVRSVMTPFSEEDTLSIQTSLQTVWGRLNKSEKSHYLVMEPSSNRCMGFIYIYDVLMNAKAGGSIHEFVQPVTVLPLDTPVIEAVTQMQTNNSDIALVAKTQLSKQSLGVITLSSLIDEILLCTT
jgi:putative hemolysin